MLNQQPTPLLPRPKPYGQIPVHHVDAEPRPLTAAELERFKYMIPRDTPRQHVQNPARRENVSLRVRGSSRFRNGQSQQGPRLSVIDPAVAPITPQNAALFASLQDNNSSHSSQTHSLFPANFGVNRMNQSASDNRVVAGIVSNTVGESNAPNNPRTRNTASTSGHSASQNGPSNSSARNFDGVSALVRLYTRMGLARPPNSIPSATTNNDAGRTTQRNSGKLKNV